MVSRLMIAPVSKKYVTKEYHEGQAAYLRNEALTQNPYIKDKNAGRMWYWIFGWQDAMAEDVRGIREMILMASATVGTKH